MLRFSYSLKFLCLCALVLPLLLVACGTNPVVSQTQTGLPTFVPTKQAAPAYTPIPTSGIAPTPTPGDPTPTAIIPTASHNPYDAQQQKLVVIDSLFFGNLQAFNINPSCKFATSAYHVTMALNYGGDCIADKGSYTDFTYEIQMTFMKTGPNFSGGGLVFRRDLPTATHYEFVIFESGKFSVDICKGNDCSSQLTGYPTDNTVLPTFKTGLGATNTLAVVAKGNTFTFYINGQKAFATQTDATNASSAGQIGVLGLGGSTGNGVDVAYNNLRIWQ